MVQKSFYVMFDLVNSISGNNLSNISYYNTRKGFYVEDVSTATKSLVHLVCALTYRIHLHLHPHETHQE